MVAIHQHSKLPTAKKPGEFLKAINLHVKLHSIEHELSSSTVNLLKAMPQITIIYSLTHEVLCTKQ